jgi:predicted O-methyltransferase YrrM
VSIAQIAWRWCAAWPGRRYLESLREAGLPAALYPPLRVLLDPTRKTLTARDRSVVSRIESLRVRLAAQPERYYVAAIPAKCSAPARIVTPSASAPPVGAVTRTARWIAHTASVSEYWGTFLYFLASEAGSRSILELGSCAGISACYLASAPGCRKLVTIDGSQSMALLAEHHLTQMIGPAIHSRVIKALFDDGLDEALREFTAGIDLAHIDGHHDREPTLRYFNRIVPHLNPGSLIVFDDICLYPEMWEAWQILRASAGVACAVNTGRYGVVLWDGSAREVLHFDISRFTGRWTVGKPRTQ